MISPYLTRNALPEFTKERVACDPQRVGLYKMEREFTGISVSCPTPRRILQEVSNNACRYYRVKPVKVVVFHNPRRRIFGESLSFYYPDEPDVPNFNCTIRLNRAFHGAHMVVLLHELTHYITDRIYKGHEDHGRQFVGVYMHLLDKYHIFPNCAFRALAKKHRVKIAGKFKPEAIRG